MLNFLQQLFFSGQRRFLFSVCALFFIFSCGQQYQSGTSGGTTTGSSGGGSIQLVTSQFTTLSNPFSVQAGSSSTLAFSFVPPQSGKTIASMQIGSPGSPTSLQLPSGWTFAGSSSLNSNNTLFTTNIGQNSSNQILLTYSPTNVTSGIQALSLIATPTYTDGTTGTPVPFSAYYQATSTSNVHAVVNSASPMTVSSNPSSGTQNAIISFLSDGTSGVTNFSFPISSVVFPAGWGVSPSFVGTSVTCTQVTASCVLPVQYNPALAGGSTGLSAININAVGTPSSSSGPSSPQTFNFSVPVIASSNASDIPPVNVITNSGQNIISSSIGSQVPIAVTLVNTSNSPVTISASSQTLPAGLTLASSGGSTLVIPPITSGTPGSNSSTIYLTYTPPTNAQPGPQTQGFILNGTTGSTTTPIFVLITIAVTPFGVNNLLYSSPSLGNVGSTASGTGIQKIPVYFYTDNSGLATAVSLTLSAPQYAALAANGITLTDSAGITLSPSNQLLCSSVSGASCGLYMNYTSSPSFNNGQVILPYSYFNAGGVANSGTIALTLTPSSVNTQVMTTVVGGSNVQAVYNTHTPTAKTVKIDFTANSTGGVLNSINATLPAGWTVSSAPTLPCNILISPSACSITYSYSPTSVGASGAFSVSYTSTVGSTTSTASIPITYSSVAPPQPSAAQFLPFRYLSPFAGGVLPPSAPPGTGTNVILKCPIAGDGTTTLASCTVAATMPTSTSDYYQSIEIIRFDATHQYLYAISPTTQKIARCTLISSTPTDPNYGNFSSCTTTFGATPNTAIPATGLGIARMVDGNTYIFYESGGVTPGNFVIKCLLNSLTGDASGCVQANTPSLTQPNINNAYSFDFTYDQNNDATRIYITDINPPAKLYACALDSSGGFAVSQPATCKNGITLPSDFSSVSYKPQSIRIKKINAINYAFIGADNSTPTGKIFICQINPTDGGFGSTPQCTGALSYQGGLISGFTPKGGIQVYPDANYLYAAIGNTSSQPSVCQIDMDCLSKNPASISSCSPGGIFPMGSGVQSCHAIDSNNPSASLSAFGLW